MTHSYSRPLGAFLPQVDGPKAQLEATGLQLDSRQVMPGDVFFALAAEPLRNAHIAQALQKGARWIVVDQAHPSPAVPADKLLPMPAPKLHLAQWAARFYQQPSQAMTLIGITGTNGKSTTAFLLAQLLEGVSGQKGGVIGTLGFGHWQQSLTDTGKTTPDAIAVQRILHSLVDEGVTQVAMEVSSHALDQGRVEAVQFAAAVFTNLTRDHLDYHGDMVTYAQAKQRLFHWPHLPLAVLNQDDPYGAEIAATIAPGTRVLTYGLQGGSDREPKADLVAEHCAYTTAGISFDLCCPWGRQKLMAPLLGRFNVENLLASLATLLALYPQAWPQLPGLVAQLQPVTGRMHLIVGPASAPKVVVDYAHTPDALEKALAAVRVHATGKVWVVFGCGGDRDRGKRALMAQAAENGADRVVLTSDNPRTEDPQQILAEIQQGLKSSPWRVEVDRCRAIAAAVAAAEADDWVLLAGKGHETYQLVGEQVLPLSDIAEAQAALALYSRPETL